MQLTNKIYARGLICKHVVSIIQSLTMIAWKSITTDLDGVASSATEKVIVQRTVA